MSSPCINPSVRKEWRTLTTMERSDWMKAVKCLNALPHDDLYIPTGASHEYMPPLNTSSSYYDDFVYFHLNYDNYIHFTGLFFPWHRWYIHNFESALQSKCGYIGPTPYWNWTQDAPDVYNSPMFQDPSPDSGFGSWGLHSDDFRVNDGAFSSSSSFSLAYPLPHTLRREYDLHPYRKSLQPEFLKDPSLPANLSFTKEELDEMINGYEGDFSGFHIAFEDFQGPHAAVHLVLGGDMSSSCPANAPKECVSSSKWAPNEPLFWLHHAMVDKVWYEWQRKHDSNARSFKGGSIQQLQNVTIFRKYPDGGPPFLHLESLMPGDGLFPNITISEVMNTTGGYLCYVYE